MTIAIQTALVLWGQHPGHAGGVPIKLCIGSIRDCNAQKRVREREGGWHNLQIVRFGQCPGKPVANPQRGRAPQEHKMDAKHTPGPWETSPDAVPPGHTQVTVYAEATGRRVATAFETPANARLIAAAPDLLEACTLLLCTVGLNLDETDPEDYPAIDAARAAIAKAVQQ